jgi:hypothetical protein
MYLDGLYKLDFDYQPASAAKKQGIFNMHIGTMYNNVCCNKERLYILEVYINHVFITSLQSAIYIHDLTKVIMWLP